MAAKDCVTWKDRIQLYVTIVTILGSMGLFIANMSSRLTSIEKDIEKMTEMVREQNIDLRQMKKNMFVFQRECCSEVYAKEGNE